MNDHRNNRRGAAILLLFYVTQSGEYSLTIPAGTTWAGGVPVTATPDQ